MSVRSFLLPLQLLTLVVVEASTEAQVDSWTSTTIASEQGALSIVAGDIDRDGDWDAVAASRGLSAQKIAWLENEGLGASWTQHVITTQLGGVMAVNVGDVDGDFDLDVLAAFRDDDRIAWFENASGDGSTWIEHTVSTATLLAEWVDTADVDGDGDIDVLSASFADNTIAWHENVAGDGSSWVERVISTAASGAKWVFARDMDDDGDVDALSASKFDDKLAWYENTAGDGSAWITHAISTSFDGPHSAFPADLDRDGDLDVLAAGHDGDKVSWFEDTDGLGTSWVEHVVTTNVDGPRIARTADLDRDGDLDVFLAAKFNDRLSWFENATGDGRAWNEYSVSNVIDEPQAAFAADIDLDGDPDLLSASSKDDAFRWYASESSIPASGPWSTRVIGTTADGPRALFAADVDGDGDTDTLVASVNDSELAWFENAAGDGSGWQEHLVVSGAPFLERIFAGDLDGDGDVDVVSGSVAPDELAWHENASGDGTVWTEASISTNLSGLTSVGAADLDDDGDLDALSSSRTDDKVAWFENTAGDGSSWTERALAVPGDVTEIVSVDVDGDMDVDVVAACSNGDQLLWFENVAGDGSSWSQHVITTTVSSPFALFAADVDGDGDVDVLSDEISWHENLSGDGTSWSEHSIATGNAATSVSAADLDGDGDVDGLFASASTAEVYRYENLSGDGTSWAREIIARDVFTVQDVFAADVDGDGIDEPLSAGLHDRIAWHERTGGSTVYGCGSNPWNSLRLLSPPPALGQTVTFGVDNPFGTQAAGALPLLFRSLEADPAFPCGTSLANFGMRAPGAPSELLLSVAPGDLLNPALVGPPWSRPGEPTSISITVPNLSSLAGAEVFFQAVLLDLTAAFGIKLALTDAVQVEIGP